MALELAPWFWSLRPVLCRSWEVGLHLHQPLEFRQLLLLLLLQVWLSSEGSPSSRIDCADFKDERDMEALEYQLFERRRNV